MLEMGRRQKDKKCQGESEGKHLVWLVLNFSVFFPSSCFYWICLKCSQLWTTVHLQPLIVPGNFKCFFSNTTPFWKMGLPQKVIVLMSGKTVTLWSHRGWNPNPCWRQEQHPQWQQRVQDVMGSAFGCCSELETLRGWDLCSCVASRHCRKANAKLSCEQWK